MPNPLKHHRLWLLAWALGTLLGGALVTRAELGKLQDAFDTDARIVHRLLSQQAVQHDAILQTLALLHNPDADDNPEQRLPSVYPQILSVWRSDAHNHWDDPALQRAQDDSLRLGHPALADVDTSRQRYRLELAGSGTSYALTIDVRTMVPWNDWPMDPATSPVQVTLALGEDAIVLQAGHTKPEATGGWNFFAQKTLAAPSQPFVVISLQHLGWAAVPWAGLAAASTGWTLLLLAARALLAQSQNRRRAEERLRMGQLTRLNTMGELAAGMAHELNQPLAAVLASTQAAHRMLADEPVEDMAAVRQALQQTVQQARRAADVVGRLRRTVERSNMASEAQVLNPMELTRKAVYLLEPELQRSQITPQLKWVGEPFDIHGDAVALEQILHNLLSNAVHALEQVPVGRRALEVQLQRASGQGQLTVRDSGPGIPANVLPHVFAPFFTTREDGLGLGLSLCETLAMGMGGSLTASSPASGGATFCLSLPLAPHPTPSP
ncbi:MAG: two-component sensor histidine kinase [Burkholderiales bacterium]|nr:two-component sensor histidine kinase [Burkholderiales bacterium]